MKKRSLLNIAAASLLVLISGNHLTAQTRVILNGAKITLANNAVLVLENPSPEAISRKSGHLISEGENNQVKWLTGNAAGTYVIPFGRGASDYFPLTFTKNAGTGNGYFRFATYGTTWQNSTQLPSGVTHAAGTAPDNSAMVVDRFWKIEALDYTTKPELSNLKFTYLPAELAAPNTIAEEMLGAQRWNETTNSWGGFPPAGEVSLTEKNVLVAAVPAQDLFTWWTLVDRSSPLPLELLSFEARKTKKTVALTWLTAQEINFAGFEIQRSPDARNFNTLGQKPGLGGTQQNYQFTDEKPLTGTAYYRLKLMDLDGSFTYSPIKTVTTEETQQITAFPNPTSDRKFQLLTGDLPKGIYNLTVSDLKGTQVYNTSAKISQQIHPVTLPATLPAGMYLVTLQNQEFVTQFKLAVK